MMVPITRLICMAPAPSTPGPISLSSRRTRGVSRGRGSLSAMPARRQATASHRNCATPANATAQASVRPGSPVSGMATASARISTTLSSIGAAAAAANRLTVLRTPP